MIVDLPAKGKLTSVFKEHPEVYLEEVKIEKVYEDFPLRPTWTRHYCFLKSHPPSREDIITKLIEAELDKGASVRDIACKLIKERV